MRRAPDDFAGQDLTLLYVATKLKYALQVEELLTDAGIDYVVETDEYIVGFLFQRIRVGAFFYVPAESDGPARELLSRVGFTPHAP